MITATDKWKNNNPGALMGFMGIRNVSNPAYSEGLETKKQEVLDSLKAKFTTKDELLDFANVKPYIQYYKGYKKTYHVLQQMETVIFKGKTVPSVAALVEAMFIEELASGLLMAGHDMAKIRPPIMVDLAESGEEFTGISGKVQVTKKDDMLVRDSEGILTSILCGADSRTKINDDTRVALFVIYGPPGVARDEINLHLLNIHQNIKLFSPEAEIDFLEILESKSVEVVR